jgi:DNA-3-methyladenine glycosylase II
MKLLRASQYLHQQAIMAPTTRRRAAVAAQSKLLSTFKPSKVTKKPSHTNKKHSHGEQASELPEQRTFIAVPAEAATNLHSLPSRPASPTATNAPLETSAGDVVVSYALPGVPAATTSTGRILEDAKAHLLAQAPSLAATIARHECALFTEAGLSEVVDPFQSLASGVISQQVSGAAAKAIKTRFVALFSGELAERKELNFPTPAMVLRVDQATLRTAGLSQRKAEYLHSLASAFENGDVSAEFFATASNQEIIDHLTKIRGIGVWSAEMFLIFGLRRMDVFSTGDLGIQRGMAAFAGRNVKSLKTTGKGKWKYMSEKDMKEISEKFKCVPFSPPQEITDDLFFF